MLRRIWCYLFHGHEHYLIDSCPVDDGDWSADDWVDSEDNYREQWECSICKRRWCRITREPLSRW